MNQIINTNTITHDINNFKAVFSQDRKIIGLDVGKKNYWNSNIRSDK